MAVGSGGLRWGQRLKVEESEDGVCVCVCVCVWERERERERESMRGRKEERGENGVGGGREVRSG